MFSIVVANWNGEKYIENFIKSLEGQTFRDFVLYFVDNGSTDNSLNVLNSTIKSFSTDVINLNENTGFAKANNFGIQKALNDGHDFILTLNNDIQLKPDCLDKLNNYIKQHPERQIFQLLMLNYYNHNQIDACGINFTSIYYAELLGYGMSIDNLKNFSEEIDGVCAGAAAYSKDALLKVRQGETEYFDSNFFAYYEDVDLSMRLKKAGASATLVRDAVVYHVHSATTGMDSDFKSYYTTRNMHLCLYKNLSPQDFSKYVVKYYLTLFVNLVADVLKGKAKTVPPKLKGFFDYLAIRKNYR